MWKQATRATAHCLTGCAIGEVAGMAIATALGWSDAPSVALAIVLAFCFGYLLTYRVTRSVRAALASDTLSIASMELVDNAFILAVPGAMEATLGQALFWWSLAAGLAIAFAVTVPLNAWLLSRGHGHHH